jgi:leucyl-tRNA---protein transferase
MADLASLDLYVSPEHPCNYLPARQARSVFVDPKLAMDQALYGLLAAHGFRRSGPHVYRPHCESCQACVPIRVPVAGFRADRTQKRLYRRNADRARRNSMRNISRYMGVTSPRATRMAAWMAAAKQTIASSC